MWQHTHLIVLIDPRMSGMTEVPILHQIKLCFHKHWEGNRFILNNFEKMSVAVVPRVSIHYQDKWPKKNQGKYLKVFLCRRISKPFTTLLSRKHFFDWSLIRVHISAFRFQLNSLDRTLGVLVNIPLELSKTWKSQSTMKVEYGNVNLENKDQLHWRNYLKKFGNEFPLLHKYPTEIPKLKKVDNFKKCADIRSFTSKYAAQSP